MKKITSVIFAITLFALPCSPAQEVEITQQQYDEILSYLSDVLSVTDDNTAATENLESYLRAILNLYKWFIVKNPAADPTNNTTYYSFYSFATNVISKLSSINNYSGKIFNNTTNLAAQVLLLQALNDYARSNENSLGLMHDDTANIAAAFFNRLADPEIDIPRYIFNLSDNANTYSNLLARYLQSYTNTIQNYYTNLKNRYPYIRPWNTGGIFDTYDFEGQEPERIASFNVPWYAAARDYLWFNESPSFEHYQSFMQYLNSLPGYSAFENMTGNRTIGGLIGQWDSNQNTMSIDPDKEAAAKRLFSPETWANNDFRSIMQQFHVNFDNQNPTYIGDTNIVDILIRNKAIADAALAGNVKPMAENLQRIADNTGGANLSNSLYEINVGISNIIATIHASESFVFPESVVSNLDEMVKRQDEYETDWRSFYSPTSAYNIQQQVDSLEQQFRQAETKVSEISNKVQRTVATLTPDTSGLNRFLQKVKNYSQRNVISRIPGEIQILDMQEINRFLRYHSDTIHFEQNFYNLDTNYQIYGGVRISDIIEGIRDLCRMFYAGMGLYFGFKLTMLFLLFMSKTVRYLGIYLNIKALQIK